MQTAHPIIQPFLDYLKFEKRFSQHTIISYQTDLIAFFDYLQLTYNGVAQDQLSHIYVRSWLANLKDNGMTAKSINRKISTLRSFFKYQMRLGLMQQTPMTKINAPKNEKRFQTISFKADRNRSGNLHNAGRGIRRIQKAQSKAFFFRSDARHDHKRCYFAVWKESRPCGGHYKHRKPVRFFLHVFWEIHWFAVLAFGQASDLFPAF